MRYIFIIIILFSSQLILAQNADFEAYYPQNQLYKKIGVKEIVETSNYNPLNKEPHVTTYDTLGRITSEKSSISNKTTYFVYEQHNDTIIKISYRAPNEISRADTFKIELFIYNTNGAITNYYNFNNERYIDYLYSTNCTDNIHLSNLSSTFYNENFVYNEKGQCIYKHYSINNWVDVPFKISTELPYSTLGFKATYAYTYDKNGNMLTKTGIAGDEIIGDVDSFFYKNNQLIRKTTHLKKYFYGRRNFIETNYTTSTENGLKVISLEESSSFRNNNTPLDKVEPILKKHKLYYNKQGLLVKVEGILDRDIVKEEYEYGIY